MTLRKGQKLIGLVTLILQEQGILNRGEKDHLYITTMIENYIWNMTDKEFEEVLNKE